MDPLVLKKINQCRAERVACVVVTNLDDGRDRVVREGEAVEGELGQAVNKCFETGKPQTVECSGVEFFLNAHLPATRLVIIGAVHISQALVIMGKIAGYDIEVIDPRTAFATEERFSDVSLFAGK